MCVIIYAETVRIPAPVVEAAYESNSHGAGIAWREDGKVKWKKGLTLPQIQAEVVERPLPYTTHFRIASCGGVRDELCHPFPIEPEVDLSLEGETDGWVLFHNGHWTDWRRICMQIAITHQVPIPLGYWSDSRAMAWIASHLGLGVLDMMDEKILAFGPGENDCEVFSKWDTYDGKFWVSNKGFEHKIKRLSAPKELPPVGGAGRGGGHHTDPPTAHMCTLETCNKWRYSSTLFCHEHQTVEARQRTITGAGSTKGGGPAEVPPFPGSGPALQSGEAVKEQVEEGPARLGTPPQGEVVNPLPQGAEGAEAGTRPKHSPLIADGLAAIAWVRSLNPKTLGIREVEGGMVHHGH